MEPRPGRRRDREAQSGRQRRRGWLDLRFRVLATLAARGRLGSTHGSRVYLTALEDELKAAGVIDEDVDAHSVDELLGVLEGTSGGTARLVDIPPLELKELRSSSPSCAQRSMPSAGELAALFMALRRTAAEEDRSLLEVSAGSAWLFSPRLARSRGETCWCHTARTGSLCRTRACRVRPARRRSYRRAISRHLDSGEASRTERLIDRLAAWRERVRSAPSGNNDSKLRTNEKRSPVEEEQCSTHFRPHPSSNWTYLVIVAIAYFDAIIPIVPSETAVIAADPGWDR